MIYIACNIAHKLGVWSFIKDVINQGGRGERGLGQKLITSFMIGLYQMFYGPCESFNVFGHLSKNIVINSYHLCMVPQLSIMVI